MKKLILIFSLVIFSGLIFNACGNADDEDSCPDISGNYNVSKQVQEARIQDSQGNETPLSNIQGLITTDTTLNITQMDCDLVATEKDDTNNITIFYTGWVDSDIYFELEIQSPDDLVLNITLEIPNVGSTICKFTGYIEWSGDVDGNNLYGEIIYNLDKHLDETKQTCPKSLQIRATFSTNK